MQGFERSFGCRRFLVTEADQLYRLTNTKFDRMLRDPARERLPVFANQRVRIADLVVEIDSRVPIRVVRETYAMLVFDDQGCLDLSAFVKQQSALVDTSVSQVLGPAREHPNVIDASSRFQAQGGTWTPSRALARALHDAALSRVACRRI